MGLNISRGSYQNLYSSDNFISNRKWFIGFINNKTNFHEIFHPMKLFIKK